MKLCADFLYWRLKEALGQVALYGAGRAELAVDVQSDIIDAYNDSILGEEREVLCEGYDPQAQMFYGRSYAESPDIDGRIWFTADSEIAPGSFVNVRLTGTMDGETTGELV